MTQPDDADLAHILRTTRTIALVGWSPNADRPSHAVARFLAARGYRVIPVNPDKILHGFNPSITKGNNGGFYTQRRLGIPHHILYILKSLTF